MNERFKDYEIADMQITARMTKKPETVYILDATLTPSAAPGDTIVVDVRLRRSAVTPSSVKAAHR